MKYTDSFVREKVLRTFTFGAIPIAFSDGTENAQGGMDDCPILRSYGLPASMVYGYVQPWVSKMYISGADTSVRRDSYLMLKPFFLVT